MKNVLKCDDDMIKQLEKQASEEEPAGNNDESDKE